MTLSRLLSGAAAAAALALTAAPAHAYIFGFSTGEGVTLTLDGMTVVNTLDTGWYNGSSHDPQNPNYIAVAPGEPGFGNLGFNNFFAFDLRGLQGGFTTATLTLNSFTATTSETYHLFDYGGSVNGLLNGTGGFSAFNDLGSGTSYGAFAYGPSNDNTIRTLTLNAAAIADINAAAGRRFVIGGTTTPGVAAVPEPATWAMMLMGFTGLGGALRASRRRLLLGFTACTSSTQP